MKRLSKILALLLCVVMTLGMLPTVQAAPTYAFTVQPQGGEAAHGELYTVTWETNFTPVELEVYHYEASTGYTYYATYTDPTVTEDYLDPLAEDGSFYWLRAYYGSGEDDYVDSDPFYVTEAPQSIWVGGVAMQDGTYLANNATATTTTQPSGGYAYYSDGVLTLKNYSYTGGGHYHSLDYPYEYNSTNYHAIIYAETDLTILLQGSNTLTQTKNYSECIYVRFGDLTINQSGSASLNLDIAGTHGFGIYSTGTIKINGGTIDIESNYTGIHADDALNITGGTLTIETASTGLSSLGPVNISGGIVTIPRGYFGISPDTANISGGKLVCNAESGIISSNEVTISGGDIEIVGKDQGIYCISGNLTVTGGNLDVCVTISDLDPTFYAIYPSVTIDPSLTAQASTEYNGTLVDYVAENHKTYDRIVIGGGHDYSEWQVTKIPTCQEYGEIIKTCSHCDDTITAPLEKIDHVYIPYVTPPTASSQGFTTHICYFCEDSYTDSYENALPAVAKIGTTLYTSVAEALDAAVSGDEVEVLANATEGALIIKPGVTLNLASYAVKADYVIGLAGSFLTGTTVAKNTGAGAKLIVNKDRLALSTAAFQNASGYSIMPIWNKDHFALSLFYVKTAADGCGFNVLDNGDTVKLFFKHQASSYTLASLLNDGGSDNAVSMIVRAAWDTDIATLKQEFVFTDEMVGEVSGVGRMYEATLAGCSDMKNLVVTALIVTDSGATAISVPFTVD